METTPKGSALYLSSVDLYIPLTYPFLNLFFGLTTHPKKPEAKNGTDHPFHE
jgi:hypothetical protein